MIYTAEDLVAEIRTVAGLPSNEVPGYTKAELLKHAGSVIRSRLLPWILKRREGYFLQRARITLTTATQYKIPARAVGDVLREIWWIDAGGTRRKLDPIPIADLHNHRIVAGMLQGFYLTSNHIVLVGSPGSGELEVLFPFRVGEIVLATEARAIATLGPGAGVINVAAAPASWIAGTPVDIHSPAGGQDVRIWGAKILTINPARTEITLDSAIDGSTAGTYAVEAGDWLCLERKCALVALPEEIVPALAHGVALRVAEMEKDTEGIQHHQSQMAEDIGAAEPLLTEQTPSKPKYLRGTMSPFDY